MTWRGEGGKGVFTQDRSYTCRGQGFLCKLVPTPPTLSQDTGSNLVNDHSKITLVMMVLGVIHRFCLSKGCN